MFEKSYDLNRLRKLLQDRKVEQIFYLCREKEDIKGLPELGQTLIPFSIGETLFVQK